MRGAFARRSSAASGFFFWGIIDDPVAHASASRRTPNSSDAHRTTSSARRESDPAQIDDAAVHAEIERRGYTVGKSFTGPRLRERFLAEQAKRA